MVRGWTQSVDHSSCLGFDKNMANLFPSGPIIRLAAKEIGGLVGKARSFEGGIIYSKPDWNCGRCLSAEERRCGITALLHASHGSKWIRLKGVVKAQNSDFQANEVDARGSGAFLSKCPKGRWKKLSRSKTFLVENSAESFGNPDKTFAPRVQSYGMYARRSGRVNEEKPVLPFVVYRDGSSTAAVLHRLQYEIGVKSNAIFWNSVPGGYLGSISQFGYAVGVSKELLPHASRHYNLHPIIFDPGRYISIEDLVNLKKKSPKGFFFRLALRCVEVGDEDELIQMLHEVGKGGFINYFGVERFGIGGCTLFDIVSMKERGFVDRAVGAYLQLLAESDPFHFEFFLSMVNAEDSTRAGIAKLWSAQCREARLPKTICQLITEVHRYTELVSRAHSTDTDPKLPAEVGLLWDKIPRVEQLYDSASEFLWNVIASKRLEEEGHEVVPGDLVFTKQEGAEEGCLSVVGTAADAAMYTLYDVVLPVPYRGSTRVWYPETRSSSQSQFEDIARLHGLSFLFAPEANLHRETVYRRLIEKPQRVQCSIIRDPNSLAALKNDFFIKQERRSPEGFDLSYGLRVREPCRYNVAEQFTERMKVIQTKHKGDRTVVLSFLLPHGSSPLVFLREVFHLYYGHFHDLFGLTND